MTALLLLACVHGKTLPTAEIAVSGVPVVVEVADSESERALGLMYRDTLEADAGMLFVYPDERERSFWMKDTRIPLSIAYIDGDGRIVHIADMRPLDTSPVPSLHPAKYALEMNRGWFAGREIVAGAKVTGLPEAPKP